MVENMLARDAEEGIGAFIDKREPTGKTADVSADAPHFGAAMNHDSYADSYIRGILNTVKTIAMVGVSAKDNRPSYFAFKYLLERGYHMIPVNPGTGRQGICSARKVYAQARRHSRADRHGRYLPRLAIRAGRSCRRR